ncbi:MAG: 4-(cytidine 5'-diphospho)-2-C-methyl-D-erythritol kinase [Armatimonadetes bacterium]|nr:4-(cytidine 5'-diphospho)-2-C-methyl-D-erythritol kinase [Armatimonadota bacterium]
MPRREPYVLVECRAKLNLVLEIVGKRPDGYHDLATVMHPVGLESRLLQELGLPAFPVAGLADSLRIGLGKPGIRLRAWGLPSPPGKENVAYRAAEAFYEMAGLEPRATLELHKAIPSEGGLGGGSADAAGVLRGLATLHYWTDEEALREVARSLGADVPFFLGSGAALAEGIGERLSPLPAADFAVVLALGTPGVGTKWAYSQVKPKHYTDGSRAQAAAELLSQGQVAEPWNGFVPALARERPDLVALIERMTKLTGGPAGLTGSGACVFGLAPDDSAAWRAEAVLRQQGYWTWSGRSASEPLTVSLQYTAERP